jgi:hypothetical protein
MISTHMAFGFVSAYALALFFAIMAPLSHPLIMSTTALLALAGLLGGFVPDIDRLEYGSIIVHRKTLHYMLGYLVATVILLVIAAFAPQSQALTILMLACLTLGAWVHSIMDLGDGGRNNDLSQGVYEHVIWRKWLPANDWVPFASPKELLLQAFSALLFIPVSANLSQIVIRETATLPSCGDDRLLCNMGSVRGVGPTSPSTEEIRQECGSGVSAYIPLKIRWALFWGS